MAGEDNTDIGEGAATRTVIFSAGKLADGWKRPSGAAFEPLCSM